MSNDELIRRIVEERDEFTKTLREQRDQFMQERNNARQLVLDLASVIESTHKDFGGRWYPADLMKRVNLMKGVTSYEFPYDH